MLVKIYRKKEKARNLTKLRRVVSLDSARIVSENFNRGVTPHLKLKFNQQVILLTSFFEPQVYKHY